MKTEAELRNDIATHLKLDEIFALTLEISEHLGVDTELRKKWYKRADAFRYESKADA
jgi:hypothetical protein